MFDGRYNFWYSTIIKGQKFVLQGPLKNIRFLFNKTNIKILGRIAGPKFQVLKSLKKKL